MPIHDVNDAFDPTFMDQFTVLRRTQQVSQFGRNVVNETSFVAQGVVTASSPDDLQRLPESQYMNKSITIYTQERMQGPSAGYQPDEVLWHGSRYLVNAVDDYSGYGRGFVMVICGSVDAVDPPPPYNSMLTTVGSA